MKNFKIYENNNEFFWKEFFQGDFMSSRKDEDLKEFLITARKKTHASVSSAPFWAMQKTNERIWNPKQKRHWKEVEFGKAYRHKKLEESR